MAVDLSQFDPPAENAGLEQFDPPMLEFAGTTGRSAKNNNPLNLEYRPGSYQDKYGAELEPTGGGHDKGPRFAKFPTMQAGYLAGIEQIKLDQQRGLTLGQFVNKFAPAFENPTNDLITQYGKAVGASGETRLADIPADKLIIPMLARESSTRILSPDDQRHIQQGQFLDATSSLDLGPGLMPATPATPQEPRPPGIYAGPEPTLYDKLKDILGIKPPKTTPLDIAAIDQKKSAYDLQDEIFGTAREEELRRVAGRFLAGVSFGLSDLGQAMEFGEVQMPRTAVGSVAGAGAELGGMMLGPFNWMSQITGSYLQPTAAGLRGTAQIMAQGGATLGLTTGLSRIIPAFIENPDLTSMAQDVVRPRQRMP